MHSLGLQITDSPDCTTLLLRDASVWDPNLAISNGIVEVQTPLSDCFYPFSVGGQCGIAGFGLTVGCAQLAVCCQDCPPSSAMLPDGNYAIKFSVDPNLSTMVEYNYFRTCALTNKFILAVCATRAIKCDIRPDEYERKALQLRGIEDLIKGAKWSAEEGLDVTQALDMYNEAVIMLQRYNKQTCL